ncbi:Auxin-induced protein 5NG4 [Hordeum vulgare]|nr:Auxin-induced protein 5NG4 [Hordeum vulgare]
MNGAPFYTGRTFLFPPTVPERLYPTKVHVENTLRVWAMSRWRGAREFTNAFLALGFGHLPRGSPRMYRVKEVIHNGVLVAILAHFTNSIDAFYLFGRVFSCGCEFISFTTHNIFTDYTIIFPTAERMHALPSDSKCSSALRAYLDIGTNLPVPLSELPKFSIYGTPPKLSSQVAAPLESM